MDYLVLVAVSDRRGEQPAVTDRRYNLPAQAEACDYGL
jgi:hypothetical protein